MTRKELDLIRDVRSELYTFALAIGEDDPAKSSKLWQLIGRCDRMIAKNRRTGRK